MIVVRLQYGLGNQMFQYAAARHLSLHHGTSLWLDCRPFAVNTARESGRPVRAGLADRFNVAGRARPLYGLRRVVAGLQPLRRAGAGAVPLYVHDTWPFGETRPAGWFDKLPPHAYLHGFWQSQDYFMAHADRVRRDFTVVDPADIPANATAVRNAGNVVSIHVRRGEYALRPEMWPPVTARYVQSAMDLFGRNHDFLVFSDDVAWCRQVIKGDNVAFSEGNNAIQDMVLMSCCAHNVIANSSFSWWSGWLNTNPDKVVVAPSVWFGPAAPPCAASRIVPQEWTILPC